MNILKDIHFFYQKIIVDSLEGYSFILSRNNLSIIPIQDTYNKTKNDKLLFCACKKYIKTQKNGILLLKLEIGQKLKFHKTFYNTGNFEVYCFCNICKKKKNEVFEKKKKENENNYTEYILVGGFDNYKMKGLIKLYEIIYNKDIKKIKIEYIQDIQIKNLNSHSFQNCGPIFYIEQSKENEYILINYDGNIYLFSEPIIDNIEKMKKKDIFTLSL